MKINCIVIDKDPSCLHAMKEFISSITKLEHQQSFSNVWAAAAYLRQNATDVLFVDPVMLGAEGLTQFPFKDEAPVVVYLTAATGQEAPKENDGLQLAKPVDLISFFEVTSKAIGEWEAKQQAAANSSEALFVRSNYRFVKIDLNEIEYIESFSNYLKIILSNGKSLMTLMAFKDLLGRLPKESFIRIHRSYVVAVKKVKWIGNRRLKLSEAELPISNSYKDQIRDLLQMG